MFGCCLAHPRYILDTQIGKPSTPQIQLQLPFKSHWFNIPLFHSHSCDQLLFLSGYSGCFVSHPVWGVIINPLMWCHFAIAGSNGKRVLKTETFRCACVWVFSSSSAFISFFFWKAALPLGWTMLGWEIYFSLNKTHWLQKHRAKSHPFIPVKVRWWAHMQ